MKWVSSYKQNFPRLNHKDLEHPNRSVTSKENKSVIKKISEKTSDLMALLVSSTKHLKIININSIQTYVKYEEGTLSNSFNKTCITLILKPDKDTTEKNKSAGRSVLRSRK